VRTIIGVMGSGKPLDAAAEEAAYWMGRLVADQGWVLLNGGRACGVMDASARGARDAGGLVVGILPDTDTSDTSEHVDIAVLTGLREARNSVNVLSSTVVVALPGGAGTISEVALALQAGRTVVTVGFDVGVAFQPYRDSRQLVDVRSPEEAITAVRGTLGRK
jgi:uncharacterized protein (TIGR00725 family)